MIFFIIAPVFIDLYLILRQRKSVQQFI